MVLFKLSEAISARFQSKASNEMAEIAIGLVSLGKPEPMVK